MKYSEFLIAILLLIIPFSALISRGDEHSRLLQKANASVGLAAAKAQADPLYPIFHLRTQANWINDPNGPIFFNREYHMFFQHNPYGDKWGNMSWGHAVSRDMVTWEHLPIVLTPEPGSYDKDGVFSGCAVNDNGILTIIYTGVHPEVQCLARSTDNGRTFRKFEGNPVIAKPPLDDVEGFRDPFVWRQGDWWYGVIGSGIKGEGGTAFLYRSKDLESWDYVSRIATGFGRMWECPNFFPLGDKWLLAVSPYGEVKYSIGDFDGRHFHPGEWQRMDLGGRAGFYAPNCLVDEKGRRIMWGWIAGGGTEGYPWNGMLTLPRLLTLREDGRLGIEPLPELSVLRISAKDYGSMILEKGKSVVLPDFKSRAFEMIVEFDPAGINRFGVEVLRSESGDDKHVILYDNENLVLSSGDKNGEFQLLPDENMARLHIFVDRSVIEVYANKRVCLTRRVYPKSTESQAVALFAGTRPVKIRKLKVWKLSTIWKE